MGIEVLGTFCISHPVLDKDRIFELNVYRDNRIIIH